METACMGANADPNNPARNSSSIEGIALAVNHIRYDPGFLGIRPGTHPKYARFPLETLPPCFYLPFT